MSEVKAETRKFEAEVQQVLHLVIHSLYSHKEIFLRELISNAADACDKLRFEAIGNPELSADDSDLRIELSFDKAARTLTVRDSGIGMSRDEVIENLGTIARSGTKRFLEAMSGDQRKDANLIGQFGVGFYSAFVVADKVSVTTRKAGLAANEAVRWESDGTSEYSIETVAEAKRGTAVTLHLKEAESEFLDDWRLKELVRRYSDHVGFAIRIAKKVEAKEGEQAAAELEWETINHASALWTRNKSEISDEDYQAFYKHVSHDFNPAATWTHNRVEGAQSFVNLLFVPEKSPLDLMWSGRDERKGLKLYVRRVFIMDASEQLLPAYLRFIRGVVDSDDLPLNVSREILQDNPLVSKIRAACQKRSLDMLDKLASDEPEKYAEFWGEFGNVLKEGIAEDPSNRERIAKLLRFASTKAADTKQSVTLDQYIERMAEGQDAIYFITADSYSAARNSPQLEALIGRGVEVLLLHDRIDEWMVGYLFEYAGKSLRHVAKGELDPDKLGKNDEPKTDHAQEKASESVIAKLKELLGDKVSDVRVSRRLTESPSCIVLSEQDMAMHMQRLLKQAGHELPSAMPVLEINPTHVLVQRLDAEADKAKADSLGLLLFEQATLADGGQLEDPAGFVRRMNALLAQGV